VTFFVQCLEVVVIILLLTIEVPTAVASGQVVCATDAMLSEDVTSNCPCCFRKIVEANAYDAAFGSGACALRSYPLREKTPNAI
jgi:hypothetical protein